MGKTGEIKKPEAGHKPEGKAEGGRPNGAPSGGQAHSSPSASSGGGSKGSVGAKVGCLATGCKDKDVRFNFCDEHFRQFKFGLITRNGEKVLDFEKKFEHYQSYLKSRQVA